MMYNPNNKSLDLTHRYGSFRCLVRQTGLKVETAQIAGDLYVTYVTDSGVILERALSKIDHNVVQIALCVIMSAASSSYTVTARGGVSYAAS
jgi:hypothetical protein